jgi:hypothetical protein
MAIYTCLQTICSGHLLRTTYKIISLGFVKDLFLSEPSFNVVVTP